MTAGAVETTSKTTRGLRKTRVGKVVSNKMNKTIVVAVERRVKDPLYKKYIRQTRRFMAHDENNQCDIGDWVRIMETRPLSKRKNWRLVQIIEKRK
ncbi:MAG: 30S ribosomal protein S17 [Calditrichota bacterium]